MENGAEMEVEPMSSDESRRTEPPAIGARGTGLAGSFTCHDCKLPKFNFYGRRLVKGKSYPSYRCAGCVKAREQA